MSATDEFKAKYNILHDFIVQIQESFSTNVCTTNDVAYDVFSDIRRVGSIMINDLNYIRSKIDQSISSENSILRENLLCTLMDVPNHHPPAEFPLGSHNLNQLFVVILKLKLLVSDPVVDRYTKDKFHIFRSKEEKNDEIVNDTRERINLLSSYETLTDIQRDCLLCFSIFSYDVLEELVIKKRTLIHWWVGEGFIDSSPDPNLGTSIESCSTANDVAQLQVNVSASQGSEKKPSTIKDVGNEILKVLEEKGFIEAVMENGRESGFCRIQPSKYLFVTTRAREDGFFDFNQNGKLTPCFTRSKRACLLTSNSNGNIPSSYSLWANYTHFPKRLKSFKAVRTLFNVNETVIDINVEWFSRMKHLSVLHLGVWHPEMAVVIEVVDPSFLEELKKMKQLRLLNLQGMQLILKLPDSICKLIDLRILDLRGCIYLEGLPANIGALKNLIHLDITDCPLLSKLPKGIRLLSKLEVLKGFIIIHPDGGGLYRKMLILEDLLNLGKLSKLSLFVTIEGFPGSRDLLVLKRMKNLRTLNLTWEISEIRRSRDQEAPKGCVWLKRSRKAHQLKPLVPRDEKAASTIHQQSNLRKLVLRCFPDKTAPSDLLDPSAWEKLEELCISGSRLSELPKGINYMGKWNVKTLHLKYLPDLEITWPELRIMFPQMTYLEKCECSWLSSFPSEAEGVTIKDTSASPGPNVRVFRQNK